MNRLKLFLENFIVYGLGGMISKFIPLVMLPIITRLYPNSSYLGLNDLSSSFVSLASAIAVCGMYDAMFRCFFDSERKEAQKKICSTALLFVIFISIALSVICTLLRKKIALFYFGGTQYEPLVIITVLGFLSSSTNQIISAPTRIQNKRTIYLVTNFLSPVISYSISIPLILKGYYVLAIPISTVVSGVTIEVSFFLLNREYFSIRAWDRHCLYNLIKIGIPLMPNFIVYWLYNSADKVMISHLIGNSYTGIYSVASKIGHVSNLIYSAFAGGWLYFAYSTMNDEDQVQLKSNVFEYLASISFACTIILMSTSRFLFELLFPKTYFTGYLVAPYLFLSPLLLMLYQVVANQFSIIKKTYLNLLSLSLGATVNVILNYILIKRIGIEGAAVATVSGYIFSILICLFILLKLELVRINMNFIVCFLVFILYFAIWRVYLHNKVLFSLLIAIIPLSIYFFIYRSSIRTLFKRAKD